MSGKNTLVSALAMSSALFVMGLALGAVAQDAPPADQAAQPPPGYEQQPVIQPYPNQQGQQQQQPYVQGQVEVQEQPGYAQPVYVQPSPVQQQQPIGYESRPKLGLVIAGAIMFTVPYVLAVSVAASSDGCTCGFLAIPVAGPFIQMTDVNSDDTLSGLAITGLAIWGLIQAAGATMFALGFALAEETPVYAEGGRSNGFALAPWYAPEANGGGSGGLSLTTRF